MMAAMFPLLGLKVFFGCPRKRSATNKTADSTVVNRLFFAGVKTVQKAKLSSQDAKIAAGAGKPAKSMRHLNKSII
jgi:hypothetical protein